MSIYKALNLIISSKHNEHKLGGGERGGGAINDESIITISHTHTHTCTHTQT